jgi:hypothetical protein
MYNGRNRGSSVSVVTRLRAGRQRFQSRQEMGFFLSPPPPDQPPIQWDRGPGREADRLSQSNSEVRNAWSYASTPQNVFIA